MARYAVGKGGSRNLPACSSSRSPDTDGEEGGAGQPSRTAVRYPSPSAATPPPPRTLQCHRRRTFLARSRGARSRFASTARGRLWGSRRRRARAQQRLQLTTLRADSAGLRCRSKGQWRRGPARESNLRLFRLLLLLPTCAKLECARRTGIYGA